MNRSAVLLIAACDSQGIAGISRDASTVEALGSHPLLCTTALTDQTDAENIIVSPTQIETYSLQLSRAFSHQSFKAIKTGAFVNGEQILRLSHLLDDHPKAVIADPIFFTSSGYQFLSEDGIELFKLELLPKCLLVTPNVGEAERLTGNSIRSERDMVDAAKKLLSLGAANVLIKGGHANELFNNDSEVISDLFYNKDGEHWLANSLVNTSNQRATGCVLASSIVANLVHNYSLFDSVVIGRMAVHQGLRQAYGITAKDNKSIGGPVNVSHFPDKQADLPRLYRNSDRYQFSQTFPAPDVCDSSATPPLGIYPIVDSSEWVERLATAGATTIQLRIKDKKDSDIKEEISRSIAISKKYATRIFVNDYWELAIELGAYGVHLGQEDINDADISAIHTSALRLGISTHSFYEVARAHALRPSYIAIGPIFHTDTKVMPWVPQELERLAYWRKALNYPLVAIGGIKQHHIENISKMGIDGIAMITAITNAASPEAELKTMIDIFERYSPYL